MNQSNNIQQQSTQNVRRRKHKPWDKDGVDGGPSSITIVVSWLKNPSNYARWRGSDTDKGESKETLCTEICLELNKHNIYHRTNRDIRSRISIIHDSFREAKKWLDRTGKEMRARMESTNHSQDDIIKTIESAVKKRFAYYYEFETLMSDWSSSVSSFSSVSNDNKEVEVILLPNQSNDNTNVRRPNKRIRPATQDNFVPTTERRIDDIDTKRLLLEEAKFKLEEDKFSWQIQMEEKRFEIEKKKLINETMHAQAAFVAMWKSLGLSNNEVIEKLNSHWNN